MFDVKPQHVAQGCDVDSRATLLWSGRVDWRYLIIDEGHRMKNHSCKLQLTLAKYGPPTIQHLSFCLSVKWALSVSLSVTLSLLYICVCMCAVCVCVYRLVGICFECLSVILLFSPTHFPLSLTVCTHIWMRVFAKGIRMLFDSHCAMFTLINLLIHTCTMHVDAQVLSLATSRAPDGNTPAEQFAGTVVAFEFL